MEEKLFMDWFMENLITIILTSLLSTIGAILIFQFKGISNKLDTLTQSVQSLNLRVATIISDQSWHKEEITEIKTRLSYLESRKSNQ